MTKKILKKVKNMTKKADTDSIILTRKQFVALLKAVYLGNWMANANRTDDIQKEYESAEDYIFSKAPLFGLNEFVEHEDSDGDRYYPTNSFEETTDVHKLHEEYDEETLWDELAERLGERDFINKYSMREIKKMSKEEYFEKISEHIDAYHAEFEKFGLKRIGVKKK